MDIEDYREVLADRLNDAREHANTAREKQYDAQPFVEMEFATDLAERCEKLLMIDGLADRIHDLEDDGLSREEIAISVSGDFADGTIGNYDSKDERVDAAIRTAVALLTEGVVAAPIDGIGEITIEENDDGSDYIRIPYYGPIRSAGGTGQALSILVADFIRQKLGISKFKPRDDEIERYVEEMHLYDREVNLQYMPKDKEIRHIIKNCSVMIDGVQTTDGEVEGFRDLERIEGNKGRGGMCLVVGEGVAQKAPKLQRYTDEMDIGGWGWLDGLSTVTSKTASEETDGEDAEEDEDIEYEFDGSYNRDHEAIKPKHKFVSDLIAGRPVFSDASATGGFRLRYGRSRTMGLAACGYSPASMVIFDEFMSTGTQLKTERPGKAAGVAPVDSLEGPTVRLTNGECRRIDDPDEAERILNAVEEIIDVGEVAVPYGEFLENNHPLPPASYVHEWWIQEYDDAGGDPTDEAVTNDNLAAESAFSIADEYDIPLHPKFTYLWDDITMEEYDALAEAVEIAETGTSDERIEYVSDIHRKTLERLLIPHTWDDDVGRLYITEHDDRFTLQKTLSTDANGETVREKVQDACGITVRERAPVRIGARMARPEKSARRETKSHALFPIGDAGGNFRDIEAAAKHYEDADDTSYFGSKAERNRNKRGMARNTEENAEGLIHTTLATRKCPDCKDEMWSPRCPDCSIRTSAIYSCPSCKEEGEPDGTCHRCDRDYTAYARQPFNVKEGLAKALANLGERTTNIDTIKGMKGLASKSKIPEPLEKGILRAKYDLRVFRDGTTRYDMMDMPLTAFNANDIGIDVDTMHELGYTETMDGQPLESEDQLVEMMPQDIILSTGAGKYMLKVADFIDDLLVQYYDEDPYYEADHMDDLIGELLLGLAPHTSAGVLGRIVGFSAASANFASPFYHAAKRRNCFHPDTSVDNIIAGDGRTSKSISGVFEEYFDAENAETDDVGTIYSEVTDDLHVESVTEAGETVLKPITHVQRTPAPDHLVTITTGSGRELTVTPDHEVLVYDSDQEALRPKAASEVTGTDVFARPLELWDETGDRTPPFVNTEEFGDSFLDPVVSTEIVESDVEYVYNLTVNDTHTFCANGLWTKQCDGDEDAVMLLMDGLLNFSKQYLPDRRGQRSVSKDTNVFVKKDGEVAAPEIADLVDDAIDTHGFETRPDGFEVCRNFEFDLETASFDDDGNVSFSEVSALIRHPNDKRVFRVKTSRGEITVTEDHSVFVTEGSSIIEKAAGDLNEGDAIITTSDVELDTDALDGTSDALDYLPPEDHHVELSDDELGSVRSAIEEALAPEHIEKYGEHNIYRYKTGRRAAPIQFYKDLELELGNVSVKGKASSEPIQRFIKTEESFYKLLGYMLAEGHLNTGEFCNTDPEMIADACDCIEELAGIRPTVRKDIREEKYTDGVCYRIAVPKTLMSLYESLGLEFNTSNDKSIPSFVFGAEEQHQRAFVNAFRDGNGSEYTEKGFSKLYTSSSEMAMQFAVLLRTLGYKTSTRDEPTEWVVLYSEWGDLDPYWPVWDSLDSLRETLRDAGYSHAEIKSTLSNYRSNDRMKTTSKGKLEEFADLGFEGAKLATEGDLCVDCVQSTEEIEYGDEYVYDFEVPGKENFLCGPHPIFAHNTMDAPLVVSTVLDPLEVDDEAHNVDIVDEYPREFYEETYRIPGPKEYEMPVAEDITDTGLGFKHSMETTGIATGPTESAYKTIEGMDEKTFAQLNLAKKIHAVNENSVAEKIIEGHFMPDIIGNLSAFARQSTRCPKCNEKYRRVPLGTKCRGCGGNKIILTVHEGSVKKYIGIVDDIAEEYDVAEYTKQRIEALSERIDSLFEDDHNKQTDLTNFL